MSVALRDICTLIVDSEHKTAPSGSDGYPMIRTPNIGPGRFELDGVLRVEEDVYRQWTRRAIPQEGDLILAREAPVGNVAMIPVGMRPILGQRTVLIRPDGDVVNPRYLQYLLLGKQLQHKMRSVATGATVPHLNMADIRSLELPALPDLLTQRKLAVVLAAYDELIENNLRRIEILEKMASAIYREWFVNFRYPGHEADDLIDSPLGPIPEGWEATTVADAFEIVGGATPSTKRSEYWEGGDINWYTPSDLTAHGHMVIAQSRRKITQEGLDGCSARIFPTGSVMMTSRATLGVTAINSQPACTNQGFITCLPNHRVPAEQICFWVRDNTDRIISLASGATFKEISKRVFKTIDFLVAPARVTEPFVEKTRPMIDLVECLDAMNQNLRATRDLLLPKLISGEIDVSDLDIDTTWLAA